MKSPPSRPRSGGPGRSQRMGVSPTPRSHPPVRPAEVRRGRRHLLLALYVVLFAECTAALLTSPRLRVRQVTLQGTSGLLPREAAETLRRSSVATGRNWLLVPTGSIQRSLERLPWVLTARVTRSLPDRVQVSIRPRTPVLLAQIGTNCYEVDREQMPIRFASPSYVSLSAKGGGRGSLTQTPLPLIVLDGLDGARCGERIHEESLAAAIRIVQGLGSLPAGGISKIVVDRSRNLCLNMQDGLQFRIGQTDAIDAKIDTMRRVYAHHPDVARMLALIDLTCPSAPVGKIRAPSAVTGTAPDAGRFD